MNKYHNTRITVDGMKFDSKKEYNRYCQLRTLERAGIIKNLERQVEYILIDKFKTPDGTQRKTSYIADFKYIENGEMIVEDVKGFKTDVYKLKKKMMFDKYGIWIRET